jgi:hypothetical protein
MHLQIKSVLTESGGGSIGAMLRDDAGPGVTVVRAGRLRRLLEILAEDRTSDPDDGHAAFNLIAASGSGIETTGEFGFSVSASEDHDADEEEHKAALKRVKREFPRSRIVHRMHKDVPHREGALLEWVTELAEQGLIVDEVVIGVAHVENGQTMVPVAVNTIRNA